jgi:hypothetical protein
MSQGNWGCNSRLTKRFEPPDQGDYMNAPTITDWRVNQAFLKDSEEELIKRCFSGSNLPADEISVKQLVLLR